MPRASIAVGAIGVVAALPLLGLLSLLHPAAHRRGEVHVLVMVVIFGVSCLSFAGSYWLLPDSRYRSRLSGVMAALVTYSAVSVFYWFGVEFIRGNPYHIGPIVALGAFALIGWLPTWAGYFAGRIAERWLPASSNNALEQNARPAASVR